MIAFRHRESGSAFTARGWYVLLLCLCASVGAPAMAAGATQVRLDSGVISGRSMEVDGVALQTFQGIPYAAPPVGSLRWRPPQPVAHWDGTRRAVSFGPRCMQLPLFDDMVFRSRGMSEDCLDLNVWKPAAPGGGHAGLPVLVYFYGGGFVGGDGSELRYDGASLASKGLITVTVNYRLGVFGFFALPSLAKESPHHAAGNYGLLDQVAALRWVKSNIAAFGGDPARVTIAGESAGSISVSALMASPLARGLFSQAIGESGALIAPIAPIGLAAMETKGKAFAQALGKSHDTLTTLRAMPAAALLQATRNMHGDADVDLDGWLLREPPAITFAAGRQAHVPLLLGSNSQEGFYTAILGKQSPTPAHYRAAMKKLFGDQAGRALALYPGNNEAQVKQSATALAGDLFIAHTTWRWMDLQHRTGGAAVYFYYFAEPRPAKRHPAAGEQPGTGAVHSGEIEYALGNLDSNRVYAWTQADHRVSKVMEGYFANFIKTGEPNGDGLPAWPAVASSDGGLLRQTISQDTHTGVDRGGARQAFLTKFLNDHRDPL